MKTRIVLVLLLAAAVAGCSIGGSKSPPGSSVYGISWRLDEPGAFYAKVLRPIPLIESYAIAQQQYIESETAAGWWIPDNFDPLGRIVGLQAWRREGATRKPVPANWSVVPNDAGEFSRQGAAETHFRPERPGSYEVQAVINGTVVTQDVEIYPGFVLEAGDIWAHEGGWGFRFDIEQYEDDPAEADIYIDSDGIVRVPGGFVRRPEKYLHEIEGPISMNGAETSFDMWNAPMGISVMETRSGIQVVLDLGVTSHSGAVAFGYRILH